MIKYKDKEFYQLDKAVKIIDKENFKVTFEVPIFLNNKFTYIQKEFDNIKIPDNFIKIDDELYLNFDKIYKINFFEDYALLTSNTKKEIGHIFINYNIRVSNKNDLIKNILKGDKMKNWIEIKGSFYNLDNVTNIYFDDNKIIINFVNSSTNKNNLIDIRPEYVIEELSDEEITNLKNKLKELNWLQYKNKFANLDNVYNIKIFPDTKTIFINFISNISKTVKGKKIISTEFVKYIAETDEEFERVLNRLKSL